MTNLKGCNGSYKRSKNKTNKSNIDFKKINSIAAAILPQLIKEFLPEGKRIGNEWVALNPKRNDTKLGSFKINLTTGKWSDFATDAKGGDIVSLCAYLKNLSQSNAARLLFNRLGRVA